MKSLPDVVRNNYYEAVSAILDDDEPPVRCHLNELHRRISLIRLCHQAAQLGLTMDLDKPWQLGPIHQANDSRPLNLSSASTIPDCPGDWLPYDHHFSTTPSSGGRALEKEIYEDFHLQRYQVHRSFRTRKPAKEAKGEDLSSDSDEDAYDASEAWDILYSTIKQLKEEGNKALKQNSVHLAARYYDKALVYCSAAFMEYPQTTLEFVTSHQKLLSKNAGHSIRWSALLKIFVSVRLNLSMTMLKPEISDPDGAYTQALLALKDLMPFCTAAGVVLTGRKLQKSRGNEPIETFKEAKELQAKAYFRLGSAKLQAGEYIPAMRTFEKCLATTKEIHPDAKADKMVLHRLAEAKRLGEKQQKRRRKKFKIAFGDAKEEEGDDDAKPPRS